MYVQKFKSSKDESKKHTYIQSFSFSTYRFLAQLGFFHMLKDLHKLP